MSAKNVVPQVPPGGVNASMAPDMPRPSTPSPAKRQNPAAAQMSRRDSLASVSEFGHVLTAAEQSKARQALQNSGKPGPLHQLLNVFNFANKEK